MIILSSAGFIALVSASTPSGRTSSWVSAESPQEVTELKRPLLKANAGSMFALNDLSRDGKAGKKEAGIMDRSFREAECLG